MKLVFIINHDKNVFIKLNIVFYSKIILFLILHSFLLDNGRQNKYKVFLIRDLRILIMKH